MEKSKASYGPSRAPEKWKWPRGGAGVGIVRHRVIEDTWNAFIEDKRVICWKTRLNWKKVRGEERCGLVNGGLLEAGGICGGRKDETNGKPEKLDERGKEGAVTKILIYTTHTIYIQYFRVGEYRITSSLTWHYSAQLMKCFTIFLNPSSLSSCRNLLITVCLKILAQSSFCASIRCKATWSPLFVLKILPSCKWMNVVHMLQNNVLL